MKLLCKTMGIQRSSFYAWKKHLSQPSDREKRLANSVLLFQEYHLKYPSHGYRWLNAKIRLDKEIVMSDPYAHKCCRFDYSLKPKSGGSTEHFGECYMGSKEENGGRQVQRPVLPLSRL